MVSARAPRRMEAVGKSGGGGGRQEEELGPSLAGTNRKLDASKIPWAVLVTGATRPRFVSKIRATSVRWAQMEDARM